ncbi:MAG: AbrB/MazE/SpoVT family DNA-binding domain-containing protein [Actinobacteria bacterium]|nr:AbrB/MazE/SpoVT family DNA-binding domain-containing protein [Actinomycetota bacterium]
MPTSRVTRKGQITIPQEIREALGIREGDVVEVTLVGEGAELRRVTPWAELAGSLSGRAGAAAGESALRVAGEEAWAAEASERLGVGEPG